MSISPAPSSFPGQDKILHLRQDINMMEHFHRMTEQKHSRREKVFFQSVMNNLRKYINTSYQHLEKLELGYHESAVNYPSLTPPFHIEDMELDEPIESTADRMNTPLDNSHMDFDYNSEIDNVLALWTGYCTPSPDDTHSTKHSTPANDWTEYTSDHAFEQLGYYESNGFYADNANQPNGFITYDSSQSNHSSNANLFAELMPVQSASPGLAAAGDIHVANLRLSIEELRRQIELAEFQANTSAVEQMRYQLNDLHEEICFYEMYSVIV